MLRVEVSEEGQGALPAIDLEGAFVIGSSALARVRLPAAAASPEHVRVEGAHWVAVAAAGVAERGEIGEGITFSIGSYRVRVAPAPAGVAPTPPQRTESLARELMRSLLGTAGAPTLEIIRGPAAGAKRPLPPPESTLVIGRGDEAGWIIADDDLSRTHAEIRRGWDGVRIVDLESKNGTKVNGERIEGEASLSDGDEIRLGNVVLRFQDPTEKHLRAPVEKEEDPRAAGRDAAGGVVGAAAGVAGRGAPGAAAGGAERGAPGAAADAVAVGATGAARASTLPFYAAIVILLAALAGFAWIVSS